MNSLAGSTDAEDWLDISDSLSLPSLSLDDVLNEVIKENKLNSAFLLCLYVKLKPAVSI